MTDWSEQEEQIMIEQAKAGDPEANYELSQWALRRGEEEPDEPRWNRLAAKCLVKSAQAGYGPAKKRMDELLASRAARTDTPPEPEAPADEDEFQPPVRLSEARHTSRQQSQPRPASTARRPAQRRAAPEQYAEPEEPADDADDGWDDEYEDEDDRPTRSLFPRMRSPFARWGERQWRRMELICIGVCAVLLIVIAVMLITGRSDRGSAGTDGPAIPPASAVNPAASPTAEPAQYPDAATLAAIAAADLTIRPADGEYMTVPTNATVRSGSNSLRLRKGPSTTYTPPLANMPDGTNVAVYATKDNWCLVQYESAEDGSVYGWCSSEYLVITTGAAAGGIG